MTKSTKFSHFTAWGVEVFLMQDLRVIQASQLEHNAHVNSTLLHRLSELRDMLGFDRIRVRALLSPMQKA